MHAAPPPPRVIKFLALIDREVPTDFEVHLICDNYATHNHAKVQRWLHRHPRFHVHFTPTSASWLNMVERGVRRLVEACRHELVPAAYVQTKQEMLSAPATRYQETNLLMGDVLEYLVREPVDEAHRYDLQRSLR